MLLVLHQYMNAILTSIWNLFVQALCPFLHVVAAPMAGRPRGLAADAPCTDTTLNFKHKMNSES